MSDGYCHSFGRFNTKKKKKGGKRSKKKNTSFRKRQRSIPSIVVPSSSPTTYQCRECGEEKCALAFSKTQVRKYMITHTNSNKKRKKRSQPPELKMCVECQAAREQSRQIAITKSKLEKEEKRRIMESNRADFQARRHTCVTCDEKREGNQFDLNAGSVAHRLISLYTEGRHQEMLRARRSQQSDDQSKSDDVDSGSGNDGKANHNNTGKVVPMYNRELTNMLSCIACEARQRIEQRKQEEHKTLNMIKNWAEETKLQKAAVTAALTHTLCTALGTPPDVSRVILSYLHPLNVEGCCECRALAYGGAQCEAKGCSMILCAKANRKPSSDLEGENNCAADIAADNATDPTDDNAKNDNALDIDNSDNVNTDNTLLKRCGRACGRCMRVMCNKSLSSKYSAARFPQDFTHHTFSSCATCGEEVCYYCMHTHFTGCRGKDSQGELECASCCPCIPLDPFSTLFE